MRKGSKKFLTIAVAAVMSLGAISLAACKPAFTPPTEVPTGDPVSNGGFVVKVGEYVYFINGAEANTADNTYGTPVRGSLMRIKEADVKAKKNTAETVIPSLMVAGNHKAGLYVYGDRIYYASPSTVKDTSGVVQTGYLDFKSAKLNGSDIKTHFRLDDSTTAYRIVQAGENKAVYVVYLDGSDIYSYNTATGTQTLLAADTTANTLDGTDVAPEWIYYTMGVTDKADSDGSTTYDYNQIYRVRADWTETSAPAAFDASAPYKYEFDQTYIDENLDGEVPYTNLGELVLDGRGDSQTFPKTQFNHSESEPGHFGYTYALRSAENGGVYFTRTILTDTGSEGGGAELYFLPESKLVAGWDSVKGNSSLDLVATAANITNASETALYYLDEGGHHYLYVQDSSIYRADVDSAGKPKTEPLEIAHGLSSPTLKFIDDADATYKYVYYSCSDGGGISVERAVYNGTAENYEDLQFMDTDNSAFETAKVPGVEHASDWYSAEIVDGILYYADASNNANSTSYNYICAVDLTDGQGKLMNNAELNDGPVKKYDDLMDADDGYFAEVSDSMSSKIATALRYYFYTGKRTAFDENIKEAVDEGNKRETYLFSKEEQEVFNNFVEGKGDAEKFASYRTRDAFITRIGKVADEHVEEQDEYWRGALNRYTVPAEEEDTGLPAWAWALIGVGIGLVVLGGVALTVVLVLRAKKKKEAAPERKLMHVDTTDDRNVDVYSDEEPAESASEETSEEPASEEPVEETAEVTETTEEVPEEPAEEVPEEPAEEVPAEEVPAETAETPEEKPE